MPSALTTDVYREAELYCAAFDWPLDDEVDWLLAQRADVRSVLEPFCGNARYGPVFTRRGVQYWGVDISRAMLQRARRGAGMTLIEGDARRFAIPDPPPGGFDLAFCPINSIRHLVQEDDVIEHLRCVRSHLSRNGSYVIEVDFWGCDGVCAPHVPEKSRWSVPQPDGSVVHACWRRERCDLARRIIRERAELRREHGGKTTLALSHVYEMRLWTVADALELTRRAGFAIERVHRNEPKAGWLEMKLEAALEESDDNHFVFLRPE